MDILTYFQIGYNVTNILFLLAGVIGIIWGMKSGIIIKLLKKTEFYSLIKFEKYDLVDVIIQTFFLIAIMGALTALYILFMVAWPVISLIGAILIISFILRGFVKFFQYIKQKQQTETEK